MELSNLIGRADMQENGAWVTIQNDFEVLTAYSHRKAARDYVAKEIAKARRKLGNVNRDIPHDVMKRITVDMLFKFCVKDWRGLTENGVAVQYTEEFARKFFGDNAQLLDKLAELASDIENFGGNLSDDEKEAGGAEGGANAAIKSDAAVEPRVQRERRGVLPVT